MTLVIPLHVRVAMALGCDPTHIDWQTSEEWVCTCDRLDHADPDSLPHVWRYDLDWLATGPLVERLLDSESPLLVHSWRRVELRSKQGEFQAYLGGGGEEGWGTTPLEAICELVIDRLVVKLSAAPSSP